MLPQPRPYQINDINSVRERFRTDQAVLLVEPTGAGKGFSCAYIIHNAIAKGKRVIFLVNRRALVNDMSKRLSRLGIEHGVYMGSKKTMVWLNVHVASIDTLHRRTNIPKADLLIIDECHFATSDTFRAVIAKYPDAKILGLTATPIRADGQGLGRKWGGIFDSMVVGPSVMDLIEQGFLVPSTVFAPPGPVASNAPKNRDWTDAESAAMCDTGKLVGDIVKHWEQRASDRKTVVFGSDQKHARHIAEQFRCAGHDWAYVDCDTSDKDRDKIWDDYDNGRLPGISSVGVISYGWDHPICSCVILARMTNFLGIHLQQIGRGARPYPGKTDLLVLDHAGNSNRLDARYEDDRIWHLDGTQRRGKKTAEEEGPLQTCPWCYGPWRGRKNKCPYCGKEIPKETRHIGHVEGELTEFRERKALTATEWQRKEATPEQRIFRYLEYQRAGKLRGYKPGWANTKFRAVFNEDPPNEEQILAVTGVQLGMDF